MKRFSIQLFCDGNGQTAESHGLSRALLEEREKSKNKRKEFSHFYERTRENRFRYSISSSLSIVRRRVEVSRVKNRIKIAARRSECQWFTLAGMLAEMIMCMTHETRSIEMCLCLLLTAIWSSYETRKEKNIHKFHKNLRTEKCFAK